LSHAAALQPINNINNKNNQVSLPDALVSAQRLIAAVKAQAPTLFLVKLPTY